MVTRIFFEKGRVPISKGESLAVLYGKYNELNFLRVSGGFYICYHEHSICSTIVHKHLIF